LQTGWIEKSGEAFIGPTEFNGTRLIWLKEDQKWSATDKTGNIVIHPVGVEITIEPEGLIPSFRDMLKDLY
jgi:hypothetical protein